MKTEQFNKLAVRLGFADWSQATVTNAKDFIAKSRAQRLVENGMVEIEKVYVVGLTDQQIKSGIYQQDDKGYFFYRASNKPLSVSNEEYEQICREDALRHIRSMSKDLNTVTKIVVGFAILVAIEALAILILLGVNA